MAKKREKKDEEEDKLFKVPKFDEKKFLKRERRNIKVTFLTFIYGVVLALLCFGLWTLMGSSEGLRWPLVLLVAIANFSFLRVLLQRLNIDLSEDFTKKNWFTSFMVYLFTWLIVMIVLVNPPVYDGEDPMMEVKILPDMQEPGGTVMLLAKITDNSPISKNNIELIITNPDKSTINPSFEYIDNILVYNHKGPDVLNNGDEKYEFKIITTDKAGHKTTETGSYTFSNDTIYLALPDNGDLVKAAEDIKFKVNTDVYRTYYTINDEDLVNASYEGDYYLTRPEYKGWGGYKNKNVTINVTAEVFYNFENHFLKNENGEVVNVKGSDGNLVPVSYWFVNYINDTSSYSFKVADESSVGKNEEVPADFGGLKPRIVGAPGFELIVFIVSLVAVVLILKYKKKDDRK